MKDLNSREDDEADINDPWRFAPFTMSSCILSILSGFFSLNFFNVIFTTRTEKILTWPDSERILFILIYFFVPVAEVLAIFLAVKAKKKREFWYAASIVFAAISSFYILLVYCMAGGYVFNLI